MIVTDRQQELCDWLSNRIGGVFSIKNCMFIGLETGGKIVAVTGYSDYNGSSLQMHIGIDGKLNREFTTFCYRYPFEQLGIKKVVGVVDSGNKAALKFDLHSGFVVEHIIKDAGKNDGDVYILSMTKEQCKFLNHNFHKL
jgi:RimJ/RimL family protein N-acetyltransferase